MLTVLIKQTISEEWRFPLGRYSEVVVLEGLLRLEKLFGKDYANDRIVDFVVYQIYRFRDVMKGNDWKLTWCFSENAVAKYKAQFMTKNGKSGMNYYIDLWLSEHELSREQLAKMVEEKKVNPFKKFVYIESEDAVKGRFHNTEVGFVLCQQATTGWSPKSPLCCSCNSKEKCIAATKEKYPELTRIRMKSDGKQER